jgi:putative acetyltransferase
MISAMLIREETEKDFATIGALNRAAFGGNYEAVLIEKLRAAGLVITSLVAVEGNKTIGHILFSRLPIEVDGRTVNAAALAPMAVKPNHQRHGVGTKLIEEGLARLREKPVEAVLVVGHKAYYPRFGFSPNETRKLTSPFQGMAQFMALELKSGALAGEKGTVNYPEPFGLSNPASRATMTQLLPRAQRLAPEA